MEDLFNKPKILRRAKIGSEEEALLHQNDVNVRRIRGQENETRTDRTSLVEICEKFMKWLEQNLKHI